MKIIRSLLQMALVASFFAGCSTTKFVADDQYLLEKVVFDTDNPNYPTSTLESYLRQQPNMRVFGLFKWPLYVYNWAHPTKERWIDKQWKRIGEKPIMLDTTLVTLSKIQLQQFFVNKGYTNATVTTDIDTSQTKKAKITYHIQSHEPYRIRNFDTHLENSTIDSIIHLRPTPSNWFEKSFGNPNENLKSVLKDSSLFDRDLLEKERQRITKLCQDRGYFDLNKNHFAYLADTFIGNHQVDLKMKLQPLRIHETNGAITLKKHRRFYIRQVNVVTDFNPLSGMKYNEQIVDTVQAGNITILYGKNGHSIRPKVLHDAVYLEPDSLYNESQLTRTYSAFSSLDALVNVNIKLVPTEAPDSLGLDAYILTSPAKKQSFGVDIEGTNSAGDLGFATSLNYQHRNLFKGSELFKARLRGAYESLGNSENSGIKNYWELGSEASILFPRFLFPFINNDFKRKLRASSQLKLSYNMQTRPEYDRRVVSGGWSYIWQSSKNKNARHQFKLLDIDYVYLPRINKTFKESLPAATLLYNYSDVFIAGMGYTYSYNNYNPQSRFRDTHSIRLSLESAGNALYSLSNLFHNDKNENEQYELFGINYSQFVKADIDYAKRAIIDERNQMAFHIGFGIGYPYGNADRLPFERRYFAGGANSVRGWGVRELGPGSMKKPEGSNAFVLQTGDIRFDANIEYRTKLFWKFEMAAYADAGNIWTIKPYEEQPNGNFDFTRFYKEIALSYGLGLRIDFNFFLLRFDTGFKAFDPQETGSKQWAITNPNFGSNFAWHFAVGYPF